MTSTVRSLVAIRFGAFCFFRRVGRVFWRFCRWSAGVFLASFFRKNGQASRPKPRFWAVFFGGFLQKEIEEKGRLFCEKKLPELLRPDVFEAAKKARAEKNLVAVVSASCDAWLAPFCEKHGFELISTELAYQNGRFAGFFQTPNCNGDEKRRRVEAFFSPEELAEFESIVVFGNSSGDAAMMSFATEKRWISG